jgi:hypothetical protein
MFSGWMSRAASAVAEVVVGSPAADPSPQTTTAQAAPVTRDIEWGILGAPGVQRLIRNNLCMGNSEKIGYLYDWMGHVLDEQEELLRFKGVELKAVQMRVCGMFLDCAVPFLNNKRRGRASAANVVVAHWIPVPLEGEQPNWGMQTRWLPPLTASLIPEDFGLSSGEGRGARASTLEILLGTANAGAEAKGPDISGERERRSVAAEEDWAERFSLVPGQGLSTVHMRIGIVPRESVQ